MPIGALPLPKDPKNSETATANAIKQDLVDPGVNNAAGTSPKSRRVVSIIQRHRQRPRGGIRINLWTHRGQRGGDPQTGRSQLLPGVGLRDDVGAARVLGQQRCPAGKRGSGCRQGYRLSVGGVGPRRR